MYQAPELKRFGTLRELTKAGTTGPFDGAATHNDGCNAVDSPVRCS